MRIIVALTIWILPQLVLAQDWEDRRLFENEGAERTLRIISSTDTSLFAPIVEDFLSKNPEVSVEYLVNGTADIDQIFRADPDKYDLLISSAMDLQLKTANDGLALRLSDVAHPPWAQWRQSLFAFTSEPAAIVVNKAAFADHPLPRSRQELIESLRARPNVFKGHIGTYDIRQSGLGYLFATQDARASETFWRLMEVMGALDVRLYCCSGDMIDDLSDGTIAVAYNVLGSYASVRVESEDQIEIILPSDFPTTMMRTALVSKDAPQPEIAVEFVQHLIRLQSDHSNDVFLLPSLRAQESDVERATIALEPALMTFLDKLKRRRFIGEWENAVIQK
ncbi:ABC transporter substrate-binding protein [Neptunicoccus cionae]|uniref:Periplasmic iron-binding protein n=1 Tax=Neptunicoccus cionae TaxID=2035344 RepID=A0A916VS66_9RHOB|nr:ABC transporter substrate-binding protein [Amylibacter cionae]GGA28883.1 periplasmic iron-binding protein [Amylibacter cionae]